MGAHTRNSSMGEFWISSVTTPKCKIYFPWYVGSTGSSASLPGQVNYEDDQRRPRSAGRSSLRSQRVTDGSTSSTALIGDSSATEQPSTSGSQSSVRSGDDRKPLL